MERKQLDYKCGNTVCKGYLVHNEIVKEPRPGIMIFHAWKGQDDFAREKAEEFAKLGYVAMAVDLYGDGKTAETDEEALALMMPLFKDRALLRERVCAAHEAFREHNLVSKKSIGVIGYCFGGLAAIELLRSGAKVNGVVSVHGVLGDKMGEEVATRAPSTEKMKGAVLMLHGKDDPLVSDDDIKNIQKEFTDAHIDWQMHIYGNTVHAFTNPKVKDASSGLAYNEVASKRAWNTTKSFFNEQLL
ncbi:MAG: dienelactone hydrolase family protein [Chlamydiota bacterium]|nr:dienelactone hydrolase family protein [Chlamydiota bacterium]